VPSLGYINIINCKHASSGWSFYFHFLAMPVIGQTQLDLCALTSDPVSSNQDD